MRSPSAATARSEPQPFPCPFSNGPATPGRNPSRPQAPRSRAERQGFGASELAGHVGEVRYTDVVPGPAVAGLRLVVAAIERVAARTAEQRVVARFAVQDVVARAAHQTVGAAARLDDVVAGRAGHGVVAIVQDDVVAVGQ